MDDFGLTTSINRTICATPVIETASPSLETESVTKSKMESKPTSRDVITGFTTLTIGSGLIKNCCKLVISKNSAFTPYIKPKVTSGHHKVDEVNESSNYTITKTHINLSYLPGYQEKKDLVQEKKYIIDEQKENICENPRKKYKQSED